MLVRNIFTDHELAHLCAVWAARGWWKMQTRSHIFSCVLTRQRNLLKWVLLSLPELCVICYFFLLHVFFHLAGQAGWVQAQAKAMQKTRLYGSTILLVSSFLESVRPMEGLNSRTNGPVGTSKMVFRMQRLPSILWFELTPLHSGFYFLLNKLV